MVQFEELMSLIETDKNELFEKISNLEEENEQHVKEKHTLRVELIQAQTARDDFEEQLKKAKSHISVLESLNTFKDDELREKDEASNDAANSKAKYSQSQKTLADLRAELDELEKKKRQLEMDNIQLKGDIEKEREYSGVIKQELKDIKAKYADRLENRKTELGISNLAASRMYDYYKIRETINNRLSNMNLPPVSFAAEEQSPLMNKMKIYAEIRQSLAGGGEGATGPNRASLRNSVMMGKPVLW